MIHLVRTYANQREMVREPVRKVGADPAVRAWGTGKGVGPSFHEESFPSRLYTELGHQQCELLNPDREEKAVLMQQ